MIGTEKLLTQNKSLPHQELNLKQKQQLLALWQKVDGQLICWWRIEAAKT